MCVIERKTYADLVASITDGRFREQRERMRCTVGPDRMLYLLEGFPPLYKRWAPNVVSATLHLLHRDGIKVRSERGPRSKRPYN